MTSGYFWLIERGQPERQEPPVWVTKTGPIVWSEDPYSAMRFQTREAAEAFIAANLTHPTKGASARAVEHGFG